jgi:PPOX class probable F420-dependent enzyme
MQDMTRAQARDFLMASTRTLKLATVRANGTPHVAPVWFVLDGEEIVFTTPSTSLKARNLGANQQVCACVDDEHAPFAFVSATGRATLLPQPADLIDWTTLIAARYLGEADAVVAGQRNAQIDDLLVRIALTRLVAYSGIVS